jgi:hypothetical protein
MPKQYAKVKNAVKVEDHIYDQPMNTYDFVDDFLEDAIKISNQYEEQGTGYDPWDPEHSIYTSISM